MLSKSLNWEWQPTELPPSYNLTEPKKLSKMPTMGVSLLSLVSSVACPVLLLRKWLLSWGLILCGLIGSMRLQMLRL